MIENEKKIKFTISSNKNFWEKTYPILIPSLLKSGVPPSDIYFFIGGCDEYKKIDNIENINLYQCNHNSIDFTGLISILELNIKNEYWFLLHDTCYVGINFYTILLKKILIMTDNTFPLCRESNMNIGIYKWDYLQSIKDELITKFKNTNYNEDTILEYKKFGVSNEGIFLKNNNIVLNNSSRSVSEPINFYNNGIMRIIENFSDIDFFKVKANWIQKSKYEIKL